jgi:quercetin dioxygenase-like cupin family protein
MKNNDATHNRPEGERVIDAPYVIADIEERVKQLKDENAWDKNDRNAITLFKTAGATIVLTCLQKEAAISDMTVDGIIVAEVLEGKINVTIGGDAYELCERKMVVIHPNVEHSIYALKDSTILITNYSAAPVD